jgi:hypothetical protein
LLARDFAGFITKISVGVILPALLAGFLRWHPEQPLSRFSWTA